VTLYGALRSTATARLREEEQLRERVAALEGDLDAATESAPSSLPAITTIAEAAEPAPLLVSSGMELLERVRNALEDSAVFIQEQGDDQTAHQLAAELAALQAALPNLAGPRLPFARPVAGSPAT
jgi:hypothetical protein